MRTRNELLPVQNTTRPERGQAARFPVYRGAMIHRALLKRRARMLGAGLAAAAILATASHGARADGAAAGDPCAALAATSPQTVDSALGLAACQVSVGRSASAWISYREAARLAHAAGDEDRAARAEQSALALQPSLVSIRVVAGAPLAEVTVLRDGTPLRQDQLDVDVVVDPGAHVVSATAPGKKPWSQPIDLRTPGQRYRVLSPPLEAFENVEQPASLEESLPSPSSPAPPSNLRLWAIGTGVAIAAFTASGGSALGEAADYRGKARSSACIETHTCQDLLSKAGELDITAGVLFGLGAAFLGVTITLGVLIHREESAPPPPARPARVSLAPLLSPHAGGAMLTGSF
jgi:hypothetical protein